MRRISHCLNTKLAEIYQRAIILDELNAKVFNFIPEQFRAHFSVGSFTNGCLVFVTADPVWASQLRYHLPELRERLRKDAGIYQLASIKISVSADSMLQAKPSNRQIRPLSAKAREVIIAGSEQCDYAPLQMALEQLASNATKKS